MASFNEETAKNLLKQVEFYFSDSNLPRDDFLREEVTKSKDGLVSLPLVCSFSRMRKLLGLGNIKREDIPERVVEGVANLLRTSNFLKVSENGQRIGRCTKLSKLRKVLKQVHRRTIAVSPFECTIKMEDVASFFNQYAKVNSVRLPHHVGDKRHFCGTALVEFSSEQESAEILSRSLFFAGADLVLVPKSDFDCERENMIKKLQESESSLKDTSSHNEFRKGQLRKFTLESIPRGEKVTNRDNPKNMENKTSSAEKTCSSLCKENGVKVEDVSSEALKDVFQRFGNVKHIEYSGGKDSGYVCFIDSETAVKACAAVEFVGGLVVKNKFSVAFEAVNGEMEREVWRRLSSAELEDTGREGDNKMGKSKGETTQTSKKARQEL